jgi:hypothetical protein
MPKPPTAQRSAPAKPIAAAPDDPMVLSRNKLAEHDAQLLIDQNDLDRELVNNPERRYHVGIEHAFVQSYRDQAEADLKRSMAVVMIEVTRPEVAKVTEAVAKAYVAVDQRVIDAGKRLHDWELLLSQWAVLKDTFYDRRREIDLLVRLHESQYYDPQALRDNPQREKMVDELRSKR